MVLQLPFGNELLPLLIIGFLIGYFTNDKRRFPILSDPFVNFLLAGLFVSLNPLLELVDLPAVLPEWAVVLGASYSFGSLVERGIQRWRNVRKK